ncbi:hypothetical protein ACI5KX_13420 [Erythrobacter sp. GH1-10]|uniref:hypothetical protein n=1 Tax=Erythrobacter sp. GH1-10 TaxID=3349334 RepID=UPI00387822E0
MYKINSLEDSAIPDDGKITYRECALALEVTAPYAIPAGRPRYCVFEVSGAITLQSPAQISQPKIYIAGQTSPGGIEFRLGSQYSPVDSLIDTRGGGDHAVVRHIRARLGEHPGRMSDNGDAVRTNGTSFQIFDHVSAMFATDESLNLAGCVNCTVQWSIIGPNICEDAGHSEGQHCNSLFIKPADYVTVAYNLSQHGERRGLNIAPGVEAPVRGTSSQADLIGNFLYNFVEEGGLLSNGSGAVYANYISNSFFEGPRFNNNNGNYLGALYILEDRIGFGFSIHARDNISPWNSDPADFQSPFGLFGATTPWTVCTTSPFLARDCSTTGLDLIQNNTLVTAPGAPTNWLESWMIVSAEQARRNVLSFAGADLCRDGACRDNVDRMFIEDVQTCDAAPRLFENAWTSTVAATGGYAQLTSTGPALLDSDNDGMPDTWEAQYSATDPNVWDANDDPDGDGYPNIEEYLNMLSLEDTRYRGIYTAGDAASPPYNCGQPQR